MEANYFTEVCKEVLNEPRFSGEELESSHFFHSAATWLLHHETSRMFSNKLESLLEELFSITLNLGKLWPVLINFAVGDTLKLEWKKYCEQVDVGVNPLFYQYQH